MSEQDPEPDDETIEQETAVPLPERDAMSIISGGPQPLPAADGDLVPTLDPADPPVQPSPRYDI
jgi:hypothetical protein